jgi:Putative beta-lactamase-inhibitor-like, PepSY-like
MMFRALRFVVTIGVVTGCVATGAAQPPATQTVPAAVDAAFKKAYPKATITNVETETADSGTVYQIESTENGRARIVNYKPDGSIVNMQEELTEAEFPPAVAAAIKKRYPNATIIERVKLTVPKDSVVHYEAHLTGVAVDEVLLTKDGKWVFPK